MTRHTGAEAVELLRKLDHYDLARRLQHYVNEINHERAELRERAEAAEARERALRETLAKLRRATAAHHHRPLSDTDRDTCGRCGEDIRSDVHLRADETAARLMVRAIDETDAALAQQPADQPARVDGWQTLSGEPEDGSVCLLWHSDWIDLDFNPTGVREGFWGPHPDDPDQECWIVARWNSCHDVWETEPAEPQPTHRMPMPNPPTDQPARTSYKALRDKIKLLAWDLETDGGSINKAVMARYLRNALDLGGDDDSNA